MDFVKSHMKLVVPIAVVIVLLIVGVSFYGSVNKTRDQLIVKEKSLNAQYLSNQNELSTYVLQFKETMGVADAGNDKLNEILSAAISGRYDGNMTPGTSGSMFSAITEAYPDLTATSASYAKVQDLVISGRNAYKNTQNLLLDKIRDYETWTTSGITRSFMVKNLLGAPTDGLRATVGTQTFKGQDALDKMNQIVLSGEAIKSYDTGTMEPLITPKK